jgi:hypothetical protein
MNKSFCTDLIVVFQKLIETLLRQNQDLKRQVKDTDSSHLQEMVALRSVLTLR